MTLRKKIIGSINKTDRGLEIGPSINPVAAKSEGYNVEIVDHCSKAELVEKYKTHQDVSIHGIEDVDYVWKGESFSDLIRKTKHYDYIIASHLIEHIPDPLGFLRQCELLLKDSARLYLLVPDKRFCFDYFRPIKTTGDVIQAHLEKRTRHTPSAVFDHMAYACRNGTAITWCRKKKDTIEFVHSFREAEELLEGAKSSMEYLDVHGWTFTPSSMRLIIKELNQLYLLGLKEDDFQEDDSFEFLITLSLNGKGCPYSRIELAERINCELLISTNAESY
jgi:2-polyprenyl-3-methyl-5-hydroxy-6-metoxy-1,4-benzoquinol methylase